MFGEKDYRFAYNCLAACCRGMTKTHVLLPDGAETLGFVPGIVSDVSNALAFPRPPMCRLKRHGMIDANVAPTLNYCAQRKDQRMIFAFVIDT